jgi:hypothetical protein
MTALDLEQVDICPWALREGIVARRMQTMPGFAISDDLMPLVQAWLKTPMQVAAVPDLPSVTPNALRHWDIAERFMGFGSCPQSSACHSDQATCRCRKAFADR